MDPSLLAVTAFAFVTAGAVKGVSGMGLPTVSLALLGLWMPPAAAAALMVLPSLATNVAQCLGPHWRPIARRLWPAWVSIAAVTLLLPLPAGFASGTPARVGLGLVLLGYGLWGLTKPTLPDWSRLAGPRATWAGLVAGGLSGVLTAATGVFAMPLVPYLQTLRFTKDELFQALGLSFLIATVALALRLGLHGAAVWSLHGAAGAVALVAAFAGLWLGARVRHRLAPAAFQQALYLCFVGLGAAMLARAF